MGTGSNLFPPHYYFYLETLFKKNSQKKCPHSFLCHYHGFLFTFLTFGIRHATNGSCICTRHFDLTSWSSMLFITCQHFSRSFHKVRVLPTEDVECKSKRRMVGEKAECMGTSHPGTVCPSRATVQRAMCSQNLCQYDLKTFPSLIRI